MKGYKYRDILINLNILSMFCFLLYQVFSDTPVMIVVTRLSYYFMIGYPLLFAMTIKYIDDSGKGGQIFEYHLVNSNSSLGKESGAAIASDDSPVAKALIGHKVGDIVEVEAPRGKVKYEVIFIY